MQVFYQIYFFKVLLIFRESITYIGSTSRFSIGTRVNIKKHRLEVSTYLYVNLPQFGGFGCFLTLQMHKKKYRTSPEILRGKTSYGVSVANFGI